MHVVIVGAGMVGVATAHSLVSAGHQVTVLERRGSVATEGSFANSGLLAPDLLGAWGPSVLQGGDAGRASQALRSVGHSLRHPTQSPWWWRHWRAQRPALYPVVRQRSQALAKLSMDVMHKLASRLDLHQEQRQGVLVLLRSKREAGLAKVAFERLAEQHANVEWLSAEQAREIEPGLNPQAPLQAALHLRDDVVANSRQVAHLIKSDAQSLGARFCFDRAVVGIQAGSPIQIQVRHEGHPLSVPAELDGTQAGPVHEVLQADAVVLCTGLGSQALLRNVGLSLPLMPFKGFSITAPLPLIEAGPDLGPIAGLLDLHAQASITRIGDRIRVCGGDRPGLPTGATPPANEMTALYRLLDHWFPGVARTSKAQEWQGARPCLPDGLPVVGPTGTPGIWVHLGHGNLGWSLGLGGAQLLTDQIEGRTPALEVTPFLPSRFQ